MAIQDTDLFLFQRGGTLYKAPATQILALNVAPVGCTQPPFNCQTDIETYCVFDFTQGWKDCSAITLFPSTLNTQGGVYFVETWKNCTGLTSFPLLVFDNALSFREAWGGCTSLVTFPAAAFDSCLATDFSLAFSNCALSQTSVDNILISIDAAGTSNGVIDLDGGTSSAPGPASLAARTAMSGRGWTINTN